LEFGFGVIRRDAARALERGHGALLPAADADALRFMHEQVAVEEPEIVIPGRGPARGVVEGECRCGERRIDGDRPAAPVQ